MSGMSIENCKMQMRGDINCRSDWLLANLIAGYPRQRKALVIEKLDFYFIATDHRPRVRITRQRVARSVRFHRPEGRLLRERRLLGLSSQNRKQACCKAGEKEKCVS